MTTATQTLSHFFLDIREELIRFFCRRISCLDTAEDLAQDTYLRLLNYDQFEAAENRRSLAFAVASNIAIDHVRKQKVRARYIADQHELQNDLEFMPHQNTSFEHKEIIEEELAHIHQALLALPEDNRSVIYLSTIKGLTYAQIGKCLGITERMVAKRVASTLKILADIS
ncbi:MAG: RNA polymerase sigma factor [Methylococcaceae bacterium]|jgi:RNA polymerase sigma factor, sigma-70 family